MEQTGPPVGPATYEERLAASRVPGHLHAPLIRYLVDHLHPGHALTAILENNLREACSRADEVTAAHLLQIVGFLYWSAPAACWGSPTRVQEWLDAPPAQAGSEGVEAIGNTTP